MFIVVAGGQQFEKTMTATEVANFRIFNLAHYQGMANLSKIAMNRATLCAKSKQQGFNKKDINHKNSDFVLKTPYQIIFRGEI